jgi:hypothetical protein
MDAKTAKEWAKELEERCQLFCVNSSAYAFVEMSGEEVRAIAALLVRLDGQVEAAKRLRREGHFQADMFPNSKFARLCREFDAALQEPKP